MAGTNWALQSAGASAIYAPSGTSGTSSNNFIDGNDSTSVTANTNATWNFLVTLTAPKLIDAFRVKMSAALPWKIQQVIDSNDGSTWVTVASGFGADSGLVPLAVPVFAGQFNCAVTVTGQPRTFATFELWEGAFPDDLTAAVLDAHLDAYLDKDSTDKPDSTPILAYNALQANEIDADGTLAGRVQAVEAAVTDGDTGLAAISANIGDVMGAGWSSATDTLHQIGSKIGSILTKVTDGPLPGIAGLEALANTILDTLEAAAQFLINPTGGGSGALANSPPLPGAGWAMVGEADFDDCDTITVQCHLIVLDFSSFPTSRPAHHVCGVPIRYRLGWWCPMNGDFAGHRQFIDFEKMHVQDGGRLMNGALIVCEPGTSGHWQAWLLS